MVVKLNVVDLDYYYDMGYMICKVVVCALNVGAEEEEVKVNYDVVLLDVMVHQVSMLHLEHCEPTVITTSDIRKKNHMLLYFTIFLPEH